MQKLGKYLLASNLRYSIAILICMLLPVFPLNAVAVILVALATLERGAMVGLGALAWAALPIIAVSWKLHPIAQNAMSYDVAFLMAVFVWGFASLLRLWRSWPRVLESVVGVGAIIVFAIYFLPANVSVEFATALKVIILEAVSKVMQPDTMIVKQFDLLSPVLMFGVIYAEVAFVSVLLLILARLWQLLLIAPGQNRIEFYNIRISRIAVTVAVLLIGASYIWKPEWLSALVLIVSVMFIFAGFSLIRYFVAVLTESALTSFFVMTVVLLVILFASPVAVPLLAIACVADSWFNLRNLKFTRIKRVNG